MGYHFMTTKNSDDEYRLEVAHTEVLLENESSVTTNTDITVPLRIISDYMLRFMKNNKDAKLFEAKERLEMKIAQFAADGYDEQHLQQTLSKASGSHTREAFLSAIQHWAQQ